MTDKPMNLAARLSAIMAEIPYVKKRPAAGLPYPFVAHDDVASALKPLFVKHGVLCLPSVVERCQWGNRCEMLVRLRYVNTDDPSDCMAIEVFAHGIDQQDKGPGKAYSYAVKMGLLKTFQIPTGEKDLEQDQIEHSSVDASLFNQAMDLFDRKDGAGLIEFVDRLEDDQKIALWDELNRTTKKAMRELMQAAREDA